MVEFGNCDKQSSSIGSLIRADFVVVGVTSSVLILSLTTYRCTQSFCTISTTITIRYPGIKVKGGTVNTSKKTHTFHNKHDSNKIQFKTVQTNKQTNTQIN
jgi:hypothetical protein